MAFSDRVTTTTEEFLVPQVVDTILKENTFATNMLSKAKDGRSAQRSAVSGFKSSVMLFPIKYTEGVSGTSFSGFDTLPTSASDTRVNMTFEPKFYAENVALPLTELAANMTDNQVLDLAEIEMKSRAQDMANSIGTLFYGTGAGNSGKDFTGLEGIIDDGSNTASYGGLTRTTYTTLNSTVTASGGSLSLQKMSTMYNAISNGDITPTEIYTTPTIFSLYESLLSPMQRMNTTMTGKPGTTAGTGFTDLWYKGMPVYKDRKCTSGVMYMINSDRLNFFALPFTPTPNYKKVQVSSKDIKGNVYSEVDGLGFSYSGWIHLTNAAAVNSFIVLAGDLIADGGGSFHGKLTGITSV
jgi:hypothetical protein